MTALIEPVCMRIAKNREWRWREWFWCALWNATDLSV